ncbi:MAG TPA: PAS domain S-box protein [Gaiellaceae bacterium]
MNERFLAAIVSSASEAILGKTPDGRVTSWNAAAERLYGYSADEAVGKHISFIVPRERRAELESVLARIAAGERVPEFETVRTTKDGAQVEVAVTVSPILDAQGAVVGASTVARDIGERKRAEAALLASETSYRHLFAHHPAPIWLYDTGTLRFLEVNDAAIELYGWSREEFLAMTIEDIRPRVDVAPLRQALAQGFDDEPRVWRHHRKDGTAMDVEVRARTVEFEGRPARLALAQDVTRERRLEEELRQTQKMEAIGRLAGGIAHDFNNLLLVIKFAAAELGRNSGSDERGSVALINDTVGRATALTRQLLAFSRMQVLRLEPTDVNELVTEAHALLDRLIGEDIHISVQTAQDLPMILADANQLTQVVLNLAVNAREAMPRGGDLTIETSQVVLDERYVDEHLDIAPGTYILLSVSDDGVGMDEETRARAFEPFFTTKEDGTGFGLATVYGIVKQCGGEVWLYSEPGIGTTFKIYFPAIAQQEAVKTSTPRGDVGEATTGWETILLVEDEDALRPIIARTLEEYGYSVLQARHADDALRIAGELQTEIHLLITDIVMPGLNGRELAEQLRANRPELRVLYSSGYPADTILRHGIESASVNFIEKPYAAAELLHEVRTSLDRSAPR